MDAVVGFICKRCRVTGGVSILIPGLNLQCVLLPICENQSGEMVSYLGF